MIIWFTGWTIYLPYRYIYMCIDSLVLGIVYEY